MIYIECQSYKNERAAIQRCDVAFNLADANAYVKGLLLVIHVTSSHKGIYKSISYSAYFSAKNVGL